MDGLGPETAKLLDEVKSAFAADDADRVRGILDDHPQLKALIDEPVGPFDSPAIVNVCSRKMLDLSEPDGRQLAHAARNKRTAVVRLMLESGRPVDVRGQHHATPLHWAAFHGNADMTETILRFSPPLEVTDADFAGTPLRWAIHGSEHGWYCRTGDYGATVAALLRAGAKPPSMIEGSDTVREVLRRGC